MVGDAVRASRAERAATGKAFRRVVPLASLAEVTAAGPNRDPVALLEAQSAGRVPDLIPVRYGRMLVSPFTFYRGAALLMATDLADGPRTALAVQLCGDAHLSNFGLFASPERRLVFDLNDFDETHPGPFEWDVKRLAASMEIAGRDNGYTAKQRRRAIVTTVAGYRLAMREFAAQSNMAVWYAHRAVDAMPGVDALRSKASRRSFRESVEKARTRDSMMTLRKLTESANGRPQIISNPPVIVPARELDLRSIGITDLNGWMDTLIMTYARTLQPDRRRLIEQYRVVDVAHKVGGVGSVGTRAWIVLLTGIDEGDPLFLQAKQAKASVLEPFTGTSRYRHHGRRVVEGQRLMQAFGDILLGWHSTSRDRVAGDYYVRQLQDWKGSADAAGLDPEAMAAYGRLCAWTLARAHARSGDRVSITGYLGTKDTFDHAVADFAVSYADRNEKDFAVVKGAAEAKRIPIQAGV